MKKQLFGAFIFIGILAQFLVLTVNIILHEMTLRQGTVCRFQTAPVDPFDAFRGQYVALDFSVFRGQGRNTMLSDTSVKSGTWCYLQIGTDTNGFAIIEKMSQQHDVSAPYLKARVKNCWEDYTYEKDKEGKSKYKPTGKHRIHLDLPFTRYYMPEHLAPQAEEAYRRVNRSGQRDAAAVVRLWRGRAVIEDLEIEGIPVRTFLKQSSEEKTP